MVKFPDKKRDGDRAISQYGSVETKIFDGNFAILTDEQWF